MNVAVATHSFLCLVSLDGDWQIEGFRVLNRGHHYGIGLDRERERWFAKVNDRELDRLSDEVVLEFPLDSPREPRGERRLRGWLNDVHQISWANGGLYLANTAYNSVVYQSFDDGHYDEYFFGDLKYDKNHVNSVYPCGSRVYALLHNANAEGRSEVAQLRHEPGRGFELEARRRLWHQGCHNVFVDPPYLLYNASNVGDFIVVNLERQARVAALSFPGHTKGMAVTPEHVVIGHSDHAERHERPTSQGHLGIIERSSWRHVGDVDLNVDSLPHGIGNVNEVRRIDGVDFAHAGTEHAAPDLSETLLADASIVRRWRRGFDSVRSRLAKGVGLLAGQAGEDGWKA